MPRIKLPKFDHFVAFIGNSVHICDGSVERYVDGGSIGIKLDE